MESKASWKRPIHHARSAGNSPEDNPVATTFSRPTSRIPRFARYPRELMSDDYREETEHCITTSANNVIQGKKITVHGGQLTSVGGDYHEHTYIVLKESTKGLKAIQGTA